MSTYYRYISRESCSQFDSLPVTSLTISGEYYLATQYINGLGMGVDYELGAYWLNRAAKEHASDGGTPLWADMSASAAATLRGLRSLIAQAKSHTKRVAKRFDEL